VYYQCGLYFSYFYKFASRFRIKKPAEITRDYPLPVGTRNLAAVPVLFLCRRFEKEEEY